MCPWSISLEATLRYFIVVIITGRLQFLHRLVVMGPQACEGMDAFIKLSVPSFSFLFFLFFCFYIKANVFALLLSEYPDISLLSVIKYVTSACSV